MFETKDMTKPSDFYESIRAILSEARKKAYANVNHIMVEAYWRIGQRIVEEEQAGKERADYGRFLIRELSRRLGDEFGRGFSVANLKNFRQFYLTFPEFEKSYALRSELTWTHYRLVMRVDDPQARNYYIQEAADQSWSSRQLDRYLNAEKRVLVRAVENLWEKYAIAADELERDRAATLTTMGGFLTGLGYVS